MSKTTGLKNLWSAVPYFQNRRGDAYNPRPVYLNSDRKKVEEFIKKWNATPLTNKTRLIRREQLTILNRWYANINGQWHRVNMNPSFDHGAILDNLVEHGHASWSGLPEHEINAIFATELK